MSEDFGMQQWSFDDLADFNETVLNSTNVFVANSSANRDYHSAMIRSNGECEDSQRTSESRKTKIFTFRHQLRRLAFALR
jgi:hypothetical protein